jgi:TRAP-type mannitol/chloroaromatic compound transport system permease small subunit
LRSYIYLADQISTWMGKSFAWCIVILTSSVAVEVFMRYVFNAPTLWAFDFTIQMYGAMFMMAGAYSLCTQSHVKADMLYRFLKTRTQATIDLVLYFIFFFPACLAFSYQGYKYAKTAWTVKETSWSSPAQIQIYMFKSLIPIAGILLVIQGVAEVFRCIIALKEGSWPIREIEEEETEKLLLKQSSKNKK